MEKVDTWIQANHLAALKEMADLRGLSIEGLLQDYAERGLLSDLAKLQRAESKPGKRFVPFTRLEDT